MRRFVVTTICLVLFCALGVPSSSGLTVIRCGSKVKQSMELDRNLLNCKGDGLVVAANNITIDLGGFTLDGDGKAGGAGIFLPDGFHRVTVKNGTIQGFDDGIRFRGEGSWGNLVDDVELLSNRQFGARLDETSNNRLLETVIKGNGDGGVLVDTANRNNISENQIRNAHSVTVVGDRNRLEKNEITGSRSMSGGGGIAVIGDGNIVRRNDVIRGANAVGVIGDKNLIERNSLAAGLRNGVVVIGTANQVLRNEIGLFALRGIWLRSTNGERDNVLSENVVKRNKLDGILVDTRTTRIIENESSTNGGDGLDINGDHNLLNENEADDNRGWGLIATGAGTQGSDNEVSGNGHSCKPSKLCA